jgi:hypothetical protein
MSLEIREMELARAIHPETLRAGPARALGDNHDDAIEKALIHAMAKHSPNLPRQEGRIRISWILPGNCISPVSNTSPNSITQ